MTLTFTPPDDPASWKPEVIADSSGKWLGDALRFATKTEAETSALSLAMRWTMVREWRAAPSDDPVNYRYHPATGELISLPVDPNEPPEPRP